MQEGLHRSDVPYIWPPTLVRDPGRRSVYLDLNHWIGLAKAAVDHPDGARYADLLVAAREALATAEVVFPLSAQHYMELAAIRDPRQRRDIAEVMRELSEFRTLLCRTLIMRLELEAVLDGLVGRRETPYASLPVLGTGFGHTIGINGRFHILHRSGASPESIRQNWPDSPEAHDRLLAELQYMGEWMMLRGPEDHELDELRAKGFAPLAARKGQEERAQQEREQAQRFDDDPRWRRGRIRDVVATRYVIVELFDALHEALDARGTTIQDVFGENRDELRTFVDSMPSGDVHVSLQVAAHRNPQSSWTPNDYFDIDALALAVPYCDVVATDRRRAHDLAWAACPSRLDTAVVATPEELIDLLASR